jgi:acyl carrier protein
MQIEQILGELTTIVRNVFEHPGLAVTGRTSAVDVPGWDSFKMIEILIEVERKYSVTFNTRDMDAVNTVEDLALRIKDKVEFQRQYPS